MKKLLVILLILPVILLCGFFKRSKQAYIVLSSGSMSIETADVQRIERYFNAQERINYAVVAPDGFKYPAVRMQITKRDEKTSNWGFSIIMSHDYTVDMAEKVYRNYIYIQKPGYYILQFFYLNNKNYPFAHTEFMVQ